MFNLVPYLFLLPRFISIFLQLRAGRWDQQWLLNIPELISLSIWSISRFLRPPFLPAMESKLVPPTAWWVIVPSDHRDLLCGSQNITTNMTAFMTLQVATTSTNRITFFLQFSSLLGGGVNEGSLGFLLILLYNASSLKKNNFTMRKILIIPLKSYRHFLTRMRVKWELVLLKCKMVFF